MYKQAYYSQQKNFDYQVKRIYNWDCKQIYETKLEKINIENWLSENIEETKSILTTSIKTFNQRDPELSNELWEAIDKKFVINTLISYLIYSAINPRNTKSARKLFIFSCLAENKNHRINALANLLMFTLRTHIPREKLINLHNYINYYVIQKKTFDPYRMALILAKRNPSKILKTHIYKLANHPTQIDTTILEFQQILSCKYNKGISKRRIKETLSNKQKQSLNLLKLLITYINNNPNLSIPQ